RTPPPPEPVKETKEGPPPAPRGDPITILSLSDQPVPIDRRVVVPPGNIAQESGEAAAGRGTATAKTEEIASAAAKANAAPKNDTNGSGRGSVGSGIGAAVAGASPTGNIVATVGGSNPAASGRRRVPPGQFVIRSVNGNYDAVVIQSSPVDQYTES